MSQSDPRSIPPRPSWPQVRISERELERRLSEIQRYFVSVVRRQARGRIERIIDPGDVAAHVLERFSQSGHYVDILENPSRPWRPLLQQIARYHLRDLKRHSRTLGLSRTVSLTPAGDDRYVDPPASEPTPSSIAEIKSKIRAVLELLTTRRRGALVEILSPERTDPEESRAREVPRTWRERLKTALVHALRRRDGPR